VHACVAAVGLSDTGTLLPNVLSGGMLKRAALARAIMLDPVILLCDEPFSGLDPISVKRIEALLMRLNRQRGITIILVSHHIASTMRMADRVLLLFPEGPVVGSPAELQESGDERVIAFLSEEAGPATPDDPGTTAVGARRDPSDQDLGWSVLRFVADLSRRSSPCRCCARRCSRRGASASSWTSSGSACSRSSSSAKQPRRRHVIGLRATTRSCRWRRQSLGAVVGDLGARLPGRP
jgi:hypothetical protein